MNFMRVSWGMSALVWFAVIVLCCVFWGWWASLVAVIFGLFPDVALIGAFAGEGRLKPGRVRLYNTLHTMTYPIVLLVVGLIVFVTTGALAWFVHIAADRALGFGLRAPDGSIIPVGYQLS
jgi:hypothetical protein